MENSTLFFEGFPNSSPAYRRSCVHEGAGVGDGQRGGARQPRVRGGLQPARPVRVDQGRRGTNHILFLGLTAQILSKYFHENLEF